MNSEPQQPIPPSPPAEHTSAENGHTENPMGRPMGSSYEPIPEAPAEGPNKLIIAIAATGLAIAIFGLARQMFFAPSEAEAAPVARQPSPWETQQQLMREAIDTARAAQQMQMQHQANMQRAIEAHETGFYPEEDW